MKTTFYELGQRYPDGQFSDCSDDERRYWKAGELQDGSWPIEWLGCAGWTIDLEGHVSDPRTPDIVLLDPTPIEPFSEALEAVGRCADAEMVWAPHAQETGIAPDRPCAWSLDKIAFAGHYLRLSDFVNGTPLFLVRWNRPATFIPMFERRGEAEIATLREHLKQVQLWRGELRRRYSKEFEQAEAVYAEAREPDSYRSGGSNE